MYKFNKNQKIVIGIIFFIIFLAIGIYVYYSESNNEIEYTNLSDNNMQNQNSNQTDTSNNDENKVVVYVLGAVNKEGVFELKQGDRIKDAIDIAGGINEQADISQINLAFLLEDGMKIYIPNNTENLSQNQNDQKNKDDTDKYITSSSGILDSNSSSNNNNTKTQSKTSKININTASESELDSIPGIGPSTAQKIITYRKENGKFNNIEDIKNVSGIGESKYNNIKDLITVK